MRSLIKVCKSLSDETRLRVLNLLLEKECCVCEVMQTLGISQTRASRNLNILREAGFLKLKKEGLWSLYSIDKEEMEDYLSDLINVVSKALDGNEVLILDKNRLNKAKRVGPTHITSL
jgi:ArsR family transcriptional regulator